MSRWIWFLVLGGLAAAVKDAGEDGCNLQVINSDILIPGAPDAASTPASIGSTAALLETKQPLFLGEGLLLDGLRLFPGGAFIRRKEQELQSSPSHAGYVNAVYSFASPPLTQRYQLLNGRRADGIFPGLRVWVVGPQGFLDVVSRASFWYRHPKMASLEVIIGNVIGNITLGNFSTSLYNGSATTFDPRVTDTGSLPRVDQALPCVDLKACHVNYYWLNYSGIGEPELDLMHRFCLNTEEKWPLELVMRDARLQGYRMIGRAQIEPQAVFNFRDNLDPEKLNYIKKRILDNLNEIKKRLPQDMQRQKQFLDDLQNLLPDDMRELLPDELQKLYDGDTGNSTILRHLRELLDDHDTVHLYQHEVSLECVLAFEGSDNSLNDWTANVRADTKPFCGFPEVHHGLGEKLRHQTRSLAWFVNIETKLQTCGNLTVTGHSQGGALAELFAACANRVDLSDEALGQADYAAVTWTPSAPRLLDEFA